MFTSIEHCRIVIFSALTVRRGFHAANHCHFLRGFSTLWLLRVHFQRLKLSFSSKYRVEQTLVIIAASVMNAEKGEICHAPTRTEPKIKK